MIPRPGGFEGGGFAVETEAQAAVAFVVGGDDFGGDVGLCAGVVAENYFCSNTRAFAGAEHHPPVVRGIFFEEQHFKLAAGFFVHAAQSRGDDARVVQHEHIAGVEVLQQIAKISVRDFLRCAIKDEQARRVTALRRNLGDEFRRQVEVEVGCPHGAQRGGERHKRKAGNGAQLGTNRTDRTNGSRGGSQPTWDFISAAFRSLPFLCL